MFLGFSRTPAQVGKRVIYNRGANPRMPEKPGFIGSIWNFRSFFCSFVVHLDERRAAKKTQSAACAAALCSLRVEVV
jgi:hypothetical protein